MPIKFQLRLRAGLYFSSFLVGLVLIGATTSVLAQGELSPETKKVLSRMDQANKNLSGLIANVKQTKVTVAVNDTSVDTGKLFHKRSQKNNKTRLDYETPEAKTLLIDKGKVLIYEPKIKRVQEYDLGKNRDKAEFLLLGFGPSANLTKAYNVKFIKEEDLNGVKTSLLELTPKSSAMFTKILLWIDHSRGIPIQMRLTEASGDYLTVQFNDIQINPNLPDKLFKLDLPSGVQRIKPTSFR